MLHSGTQVFAKGKQSCLNFQWQRKQCFIRLTPGTNVKNFFFFLPGDWAKVFVHGRHFCASLMFANKSRAYISGAPYRWTHPTYAPALPPSIRLGWKGFPVTNTPAFLVRSSLMKKKSFKTLTPGWKTSLGLVANHGGHRKCENDKEPIL